MNKKKKPKWKIVYDEENCDSAGRNFTGIISNGTDFLFFHAFKHNDDDQVETCTIYNTIRGIFEQNEDDEECHYPWTAENDERMLNALNSMTDGQSSCGENGVLHSVEWSTETED